MSFVFLITFILIVLALPIVIEPVIRRVLTNSPEMVESEREDAFAAIYGKEEE